MLVGLNVQAMQETGTDTAAAKEHAKSLFDSVKSLSDRVADKLNDRKNLYPIFNQVAEQNQTNMLGSGAKVSAKAGAEWTTALVDRGAASNIIVTGEQLPGSADREAIGFVKGGDGKSYVPGYKPIKILDQFYNFVPFKTGERPHLIDSANFNTHTVKANPIQQWEKPVPNAFSVVGSSADQKSFGQKAMAYVQANPQRPFALEIPYGFIKVHLNANKAIFQINEQTSEEEYSFFPTISAKGPYQAGAGTICAITMLGLEYIPPTLYKAIYALPGDHSQVSKTLLQRSREIKQSCSESDLNTALSVCPIVPGIDDYIIFRIKNTMVALPFPAAIQQVLQAADFNIDPDGGSMDMAEEFAFFVPNFTFPIIIPNAAAIPVPFFFGTFEFGTETWKPGSGYNGCLGELSIERTTRVYDFGTNIPI